MTASFETSRKSKYVGPKRRTVEAYFKAEDKSEEKHEFFNGYIRKMAGATLNHNLLAQRVATLIDNYIEEQELDFFVSTSDTKIRIEAENKVVYPDAVVICAKPIFYLNRKDTITNPLIVIEVLSHSTEDFDRVMKFDYYRTIPSFKEYVLVRQDRKMLSVYSKQADNTWLLRDFETSDALLEALHGCSLSLDRLYRGIEF